MTERFHVITGSACAAYCYFTFGYPKIIIEFKNHSIA